MAIHKRLTMLGAVAMLAATAWAADAPMESISQVLVRDSSQTELRTTLTKNLFRTESYQANYDEQVPYDVEEDYTVDIPYTVSVPYTDYENYWDREYQCRDEWSHERRCRSERHCAEPPSRVVCEIRPGCHSEQPNMNFMAKLNVGQIEPQRAGEPFPGRPGGPREPGPGRPGGPGHGGPGRGGGGHEPGGPGVGGPGGPGHGGPGGPPNPPHCEPRRVCHNEPGGPGVCTIDQVCENVPVRKQVCDWQNVMKSRPVTKYRNETRYRQETRTRTVTKYRTETRCCVTKQRQVFDHQWTQAVTIQFPADAPLYVGEKESLQVSLTGSEGQPQVIVQMLDSVYGYQVVRQDVTPGLIVVALQTRPKFTAAELGAGTLKGLELVIQGTGQAYVRFQDAGRKTRVDSTYQVTVLEDGTNAVLAQANLAQMTGAWVQIPLTMPLAIEKKYSVVLDVNRVGSVIAEGQVRFQAQSTYVGVLDMNVQKDNSKIHVIGIEGSGLNAVAVFQDLAPAHPEMKTTYKISTSRRGSGGSEVYMQDKSLEPATLSVGVDGYYRVSFADLGVSADNLIRYFRSGDSVKVDLEVFRTSPRISGKIPLWEGKTLLVP